MTRPNLTLGAVVCALVAVACGGRRIEQPATGPVAAVTARRGAPHRTDVTAVAVTRAGDAAVSLDSSGEVRVWAALDGSAPPRPIAAKGARGVGVAGAGDVLVVTAALPGGVGYLGRHRRDGAVLGEALLDPIDGEVVAIVPTHDAAAAVVARVDQSLELYAVDGTRRGRVALDRERLRALAAHGDDGVIAILRGPDDAFVARRYRPHLGALLADRDVALPTRPADGLAVAVSPDGARLAYQAEIAGDRGGWVASGRYHVIDLASGADITPPEVARTPANLATFTADGNLHLDLREKPIHNDFGPRPDAQLGRDLPLRAAGGGVLIGDTRASLVVQRPGAPAIYLGYQVNSVERFALSPSGGTLAVHDGRRIAIESLAGDVADRLIDPPDPVPYLTYLALLDDRRLLMIDQRRHVIALVDVTTGAELAATPLPDGTSSNAIDPRRRWLFGAREGGWWALALAPDAADVFGAWFAVDSDTQRVAPIAGDKLLASTFDLDGVRDYALADVRAATPPPRARQWQRGDYLGADDHGRWYWKDGASVPYSTIGGTTAAITLRNAEVGIVPVPAGGVLVSDPASSLRTLYDLDGRLRWSTRLAPFDIVLGLAASTDGARLALAQRGGVALLSASTGAINHASCNWAFGAWPSPPMHSNHPALCD